MFTEIFCFFTLTYPFFQGFRVKVMMGELPNKFSKGNKKTIAIIDFNAGFITTELFLRRRKINTPKINAAKKRNRYLKCSLSGWSSILMLRSGGAAKPTMPIIGQNRSNRTAPQRIVFRKLRWINFIAKNKTKVNRSEINIQIVT